MALDDTAVARLIHASGYEPTTQVAVGVSSLGSTLPVRPGGGAEAGGFDCDSVGYGGSLAKQITGACAALLAGDGVLDVEAPIAGWLPELPAWAGAIRVRHLIHHTAGLPATDEVWERMTGAGESDWTSDGVIAALSQVDDLPHPPGAAYAYSNVGYMCLARIVERLAGEDLDGFAQQRLFEPLGMRSTTLWSGPGPHPPTALQPAGPPETPTPLSLGDGGLWTTVRDLLRWNRALIDDALGIADKLHATGSLDDGTPLDYAWGVRVFRVEGGRVESHGGSWDGAAAKLVRFPERGLSFAALARDGSVERMTTLSALLQDELLEGATG